MLTCERKQIPFKAFFESQFKYRPLIWMFCSRTANNRIDKLQERVLRLVYGDYETSFSDLLAINGSFTVHHTNIEILKVQPCKLYNNKYIIALTPIANTEIFAFIAVLVFMLLSRKNLFINRKDSRNS